MLSSCLVALCLVIATTCAEGRTAVRRNLGLWKDAEHACASVQGANYYLCVQDIMEMGDLGMATFWIQTEERGENATGENDDALVVHARQACAPVQSSTKDYYLCIQDVLESKNLGLAELWSLSSETAAVR